MAINIAASRSAFATVKYFFESKVDFWVNKDHIFTLSSGNANILARDGNSVLLFTFSRWIEPEVENFRQKRHDGIG